MDFEAKQKLAHTGNMGLAASAIRLRAARLLSGMQQKDIAIACGTTKQALSNAEAGSTYPSRPVLRFYYREHRLDFNFLMNGDFAQLPGDVQERLFPALEIANDEWDRKERSNRAQAGRQQSQQHT